MVRFCQWASNGPSNKSIQAGRAGDTFLARCVLPVACPERAHRLWPHATLIGLAVGIMLMIRHRHGVPGRYSAERYSTDHSSRPCFLRKEVNVLLRNALGISCVQKQCSLLLAPLLQVQVSHCHSVWYSCRFHFARMPRSICYVEGSDGSNAWAQPSMAQSRMSL